MINGVSSQAIGSSITFFPFGIQSIFIIWFICQQAYFLHTMKRNLRTLYCWKVILYSQSPISDIKDSFKLSLFLSGFGKQVWWMAASFCIAFFPFHFPLKSFQIFLNSRDYYSTDVQEEMSRYEGESFSDLWVVQVIYYMHINCNDNSGQQ